jgi:hypothetical protein
MELQMELQMEFQLTIQMELLSIALIPAHQMVL